MIGNVLLVALGFLMLMIGAEYLVGGASTIARKWHIPQIVIGLTIVSIGTSMPEFMVSLTSSITGHADISIGNVIGSNLCNLLLILGITSIICPLKFSTTTQRYDIPMMIFCTLLVFSLASISSKISRIDGIILMIVFLLFIRYTIRLAKGQMNKNTHDEDIEISTKDIIFAVLKIIVGIVLLKFGADYSVDNAVIIAQNLGVSERVISVTIVAIGTSLPELITSIVAAIKRETDIAIGNIVGSCVFNLLFILGLPSIILPTLYSSSYNLDFILLIISSILLLIFAKTGKKGTMTRANGLIYILMYIGYMLSLI